MDVWSVLGFIGLLWALRQALDLLLYLWNRNKSLEPYKYGWAVVTGATDGIGKALSEALLTRGFKLVLISRSQSKLEAVRSEFTSRHPTAGKIDIIQADFTQGLRNPTEFYSRLGEQLKAYDVSVLVNNVGIMHWKGFENTEFSEIEEQLAVNVLPQTYLTRLLLPTMIARFTTTQRPSLIIDLSSNASHIPLPFLAVYGATKTYNHYLTQALSAEGPPGVTFLSVMPGWVATNMPKMNNFAAEAGMVNVDDMAKAVLGNIGQGWTGGHRTHQVLCWIMKFALDNPVGRFIVRKTTHSMEAKRKKRG